MSRDRKPIPDGTRFPNSRLVVIKQGESRKTTNGSARRYICQCDCGQIKLIDGQSLKSGRSLSCGCLHKEQLCERLTKHGHSVGGRSPEHVAWHGMLQRCGNINNPKYADYGGRGIKVCDRWKGDNGFVNFYGDMGDKPSPQHSIGRIDNNGNYEPTNCRWETASQQANNARSNRQVTFNGRTQNISQWSEELGIPYLTLLMRFNRGWTPELALTTSVKVGQKIRKVELP